MLSLEKLIGGSNIQSKLIKGKYDGKFPINKIPKWMVRNGK